MTSLTITQHGLTRVVTDLDLVDQLLAHAGVSLARRGWVRRSGQVREWLDADHTAAEMVSLARVGDELVADARRIA